MDIWFRVRFLVLKDDNWHQFCKRNYRLQKYTVNNTLHSLSRKHFDRLRREYGQGDPKLNDLTEQGFDCKTLTSSDRYEFVPLEYFDKKNFVEFVKRFEVKRGKIKPRLVVGAELYFVENATTVQQVVQPRMGFDGQQNFPNPAYR